MNQTIQHLNLCRCKLLNKKKAAFGGFLIPSCDPAGIRTQDPYIKSVMLYQLSYGIIPKEKLVFKRFP